MSKAARKRGKRATQTLTVSKQRKAAVEAKAQREFDQKLSALAAHWNSR